MIGPQKAGTSWIHQYLENRGDVCLSPKVGETFFFDRYYGRGLSWYSGHFSGCGKGRRVIEVAPTYFHCPEAAERIKGDLGLIPLVVTLRDPVRRTYSLYLHMRRYGMTRLSFTEALDAHPELIGSSRYAEHLSRWFDAFGRENVLVLRLEELQASCDDFVRRLCGHIGLVPGEVPERLRAPVNISVEPRSFMLSFVGQKAADSLRHLGLYRLVNWARDLGLKSLFFGRPGNRPPEPLSRGDAMRLLEVLLPEIERLETMTGMDLRRWKEYDVAPGGEAGESLQDEYE